jgi:hypothetical protein
LTKKLEAIVDSNIVIFEIYPRGVYAIFSLFIFCDRRSGRRLMPESVPRLLCKKKRKLSARKSGDKSPGFSDLKIYPIEPLAKFKNPVIPRHGFCCPLEETIPQWLKPR